MKKLISIVALCVAVSVSAWAQSGLGGLLSGKTGNTIGNVLSSIAGTVYSSPVTLDGNYNYNGVAVSATSTEGGILTNLALRALFDGKLDIKDIILIIVLLKLFKRKTSNTYNNSAIGLLGTLLGFNQPTTSSNPFSLLLGGNQNQGLFGNSYSNGLFGNSYYTNSNSGLGSFLGLTGNNGISNSGLQNLLNFVNGNYNNNSQYQTLYNILSQAAGSCVSNSGTVSSSGLFGVLNQLLKS